MHYFKQSYAQKNNIIMISKKYDNSDYSILYAISIYCKTYFSWNHRDFGLFSTVKVELK